MKTCNTLRKYLDSRVSSIKKILELEPVFFTNESFHDLRVEIKKVNALFEMLSFCKNKFKRKKVFMPFKSIFRKAGLVRELQVEEMLWNTLRIPDLNENYFKILKRRESLMRKKFHSFINDKLIISLDERSKEADFYLKEMSNIDIDNYFKDIEQKIQSILPGKTIHADTLHKLRKELKKYYYNRKIFRFQTPQQKSLLGEIDAFQELLGKWHDFVITENHLIKISQLNNLNSEEINHIQNILLKLRKQSQLLMKKIKLSGKLAFPVGGLY